MHPAIPELSSIPKDKLHNSNQNHAVLASESADVWRNFYDRYNRQALYQDILSFLTNTITTLSVSRLFANFFP